MSGYSPRKAPNVSQYIANLNTLPSAHDLATPQQDGYPLDDDLAIFTNAEFFDFDLGENIGQSAGGYDETQQARTRQATALGKSTDGKTLNFDNSYQFNGISYSPTDPATTLPPTLQTTYSPTSFEIPAFASPTTSYKVSQIQQTGEKRPYSSSSMSPTGSSFEASSRAAAEEDKRRRNTAASARFRVKKKQREQALEKTAKEMTDRADALEARIQQLEMENKWLRNLVVEKTSKGKDDVAQLWKRFTAESEERSSDGKKKGVRTAATEVVEPESD